jgi:hypothetical protein
MSVQDVAVPDDSVRAVAGFLLDAARAEVSTRTVTQVLQQWAGEGVTPAQLGAAFEAARRRSAGKHDAALDEFEAATRAGLP